MSQSGSMFMSTTGCSASDDPQSQVNGTTCPPTTTQLIMLTSHYQLVFSLWLTGHAFLTDDRQTQSSEKGFSLGDPESDADRWSEVTTCVTSQSHSNRGSAHFGQFSSWSPLLNAVARLGHIARSFIKRSEDNICHGWHKCNTYLEEEQLNQAKATIIRTVQREVYVEVIKHLQEPLEERSPSAALWI